MGNFPLPRDGWACNPVRYLALPGGRARSLCSPCLCLSISLFIKDDEHLASLRPALAVLLVHRLYETGYRDGGMYGVRSR